MFDKSLKYSYAAQKRERHRLLRIILYVVGVCALYNGITSFFVSIWVLRNDTMQPGLAAGDRLVFVSCTIPAFLADINILDQSLPFKRGNIVLVDTARGGIGCRCLWTGLSVSVPPSA